MSRIKPRTATVVIYQGDDIERISDLNTALIIAERGLAVAEERRRAASANTARRSGDDLPTVDAEQAALDEANDAYRTFVDEAADRAVTVEVRDIGRRRFAELVAAHPPRFVERNGETVTHEDDRLYDINVETFSLALLTYASDGVSTIVEPAFNDARDREEFLLDELSDGDYEKLWNTAYMLNRAPGGDPKAHDAYMASPRSPQTLI